MLGKLRGHAMPAAAVLAALVAFGTPVTAHAQKPDDPLKPIAFGPWREVDRNDTGIEYLVSFPSPIVSDEPVNNVVPLRIFVPDQADGPIPVVLILHYWGARDLRAERALALELNDFNIAAAVITLPYHLSRTPPGHRSGDLAIEPDPERLKLTMTQAALDSRRAVDYLSTRPEFRHDQVGIVGTSLGALVAALAFSVEPRFTHAAFLLGGADLAHILWTSSRVVPQRDILRRRGYSEHTLRAALAPVEPLTYLPNRAPAPSLVVSARYDTVVPASSTEALIEALHDPTVLRIETGHYGGIFVERRVLSEVTRFFSAEFSTKSYVVPKRLYSPTIRLGVATAIPFAVDLGAGIDIWRFDRAGNDYASVFVTPRGPELFLGRQIKQGLSIGLLASPRRAAIGLLWSTVL